MSLVRLALCTMFAISTLVACNERGMGGWPPDGDVEEGLTPAPRGGGFCCPIDPATCNCFRNGGWIANETDMCPGICDLAPTRTRIVTDDHGCQMLEGPESCLSPPDAGLDAPPDAVEP
jgi:hypothetical protein